MKPFEQRHGKRKPRTEECQIQTTHTTKPERQCIVKPFQNHTILWELSKLKTPLQYSRHS